MTYTLTGGPDDTGDVTACEPTLRQEVLNMGTMLRTAGYDVQYRGKWHLSKGPTGGDSTPEQLQDYGFEGWQPPEAAQDVNPAHFGGGCANRDGPYAQSAVDFLQNVAPANPRPFLLVASFGNPHDVLAYPTLEPESSPGCFNYPIARSLPAGHRPAADLRREPPANYKPTARGVKQP
jgi:arylsulfatase A-like enzyme